VWIIFETNGCCRFAQIKGVCSLGCRDAFPGFRPKTTVVSGFDSVGPVEDVLLCLYVVMAGTFLN
jgi:hypothetical protein